MLYSIHNWHTWDFQMKKKISLIPHTQLILFHLKIDPY